MENGDFALTNGAKQFLDNNVSHIMISLKDEGFDVTFMKTDGFGKALGGATFTVYEQLECTTVKKRGSDDITAHPTAQIQPLEPV